MWPELDDLADNSQYSVNNVATLTSAFLSRKVTTSQLATIVMMASH